MTCFGRKDALFFTSWRVLDVMTQFWRHHVFWTSWRAFWRHHLFWSSWRHFLTSWRVLAAVTHFLTSWRVLDVMTHLWTSWPTVDVMTCFGLHDVSFDVMTCFGHHDALFDAMTYFGRHDALFWRHHVFWTSWRTFWRHHLFWTSWSVLDVLDALYDVITCFGRHYILFDVMTYFGLHDALFDVIAYFLTPWRVSDVMTVAFHRSSTMLAQDLYVTSRLMVRWLIYFTFVHAFVKLGGVECYYNISCDYNWMHMLNYAYVRINFDPVLGMVQTSGRNVQHKLPCNLISTQGYLIFGLCSVWH